MSSCGAIDAIENESYDVGGDGEDDDRSGCGFGVEIELIEEACHIV